MHDTRSERDLLIMLQTKFENMNENVNFKFESMNVNVNKIDKKLDDVDDRWTAALKEIKSELKHEYVTKKEYDSIAEELKDFQIEVRAGYVTVARFEPVEEVHKDISKRVRTLLVTVGICVLIAAASAPTWISVYKTAILAPQTSQSLPAVGK